MGKRTLTDWIQSGSEYYKIILGLESRIRAVFENSTELIVGNGVGLLNNGEYYYDFSNLKLYIKCTDGGNPNSKNIQMNTYYWAFGTWGTQAELDNMELFQTFKSGSDYYLRYIKIFVVKKDAPVFTNLRLEIHSELNNYPTKKILATSENNWSNSDINSYDNSVSEIWFRFNSFPLKKDVKYVLVLKADGAFSTNQHLSWVKMDLVYNDGTPDDMNRICRGSFRYVMIGRAA